MTTYDPRESMPVNPSYGDPVKNGVWACLNAKDQLLMIFEQEITALRHLNADIQAARVEFVEFNSVIPIKPVSTNAVFHNRQPGDR